MRKGLWALLLAFASTPAFADKTLVESPDAPKAIGPYSQAIASGKLKGGKLTLTLPKKLKVGKHKLVAKYSGTATVTGSKSKTVTLTVTK